MLSFACFLLQQGFCWIPAFAGMTGEEGMWGNLQVVRQEWDLHKRRIGIGIWSLVIICVQRMRSGWVKIFPLGFLSVPMSVMPRAVAVSIASDVAVDTPVTISAPSLAAFTTIS